jgi:HipA-like protein
VVKAAIFYNNIQAGILEKKRSKIYTFIYNQEYLLNPAMPAISLTLPKSNESYEQNILFSFFMGLLSEGINKEIQCRLLKIDEEDDFTRLLKTAGEDTIGAITIKEIKE